MIKTKNNFGPLDYKKYKTASEFYNANKGQIPIAMMYGITRLQKKRKISFQEAFAILLSSKSIILIDKK